MPTSTIHPSRIEAPRVLLSLPGTASKPNNLWKAIYSVQGQAQQSLEGGGKCWTPEQAWASIVRAIDMDNATG